MPVIALPPVCDRAAAEALLHELAGSGAGGIEIDASKVEKVGQAILQLLLSARRSPRGARITPSSALTEAARMTGLTEALFGEVQP